MFKSDSRALGKALEADGFVRDKGQAAHHIVAAEAPRAEPARIILAAVGMDINSAFNGIFVDSSIHAHMHTTVYYDAVNLGLTGVTTYGEAVLRLTAMRTAIRTGTFPR